MNAINFNWPYFLDCMLFFYSCKIRFIVQIFYYSLYMGTRFSLIYTIRLMKIVYHKDRKNRCKLHDILIYSNFPSLSAYISRSDYPRGRVTNVSVCLCDQARREPRTSTGWCTATISVWSWRRNSTTAATSPSAGRQSWPPTSDSRRDR